MAPRHLDSDQFDCEQEPENEEDRHAVAIYEDSESIDVLGHDLWEISGVSYFFLEHDGSITGTVTNKRCYCHQKGGMEIPCKLIYSENRNTFVNWRITVRTAISLHWGYNLLSVTINQNHDIVQYR